MHPLSLTQFDFVLFGCQTSYRGQQAMASSSTTCLSSKDRTGNQTWNPSSRPVLNLWRSIENQHCCRRQGKAIKQLSLAAAVMQTKSQGSLNSGYKQSVQVRHHWSHQKSKALRWSIQVPTRLHQPWRVPSCSHTASDHSWSQTLFLERRFWLLEHKPCWPAHSSSLTCC